MNLSHFNTMSPDDAEAALRPCLDVPRWTAEVVASRPYDSVQEVVAVGRRSGARLDVEEVTQALAHHPRIGERALGESTEANLSRREQTGLGDLDGDVLSRLAHGNKQYEEIFDQVFLIRAAGRTSEEILAELQRRMNNSAEEEAVEVAQQLNEIAALRLEGMFS